MHRMESQQLIKKAPAGCSHSAQLQPVRHVDQHVCRSVLPGLVLFTSLQLSYAGTASRKYSLRVMHLQVVRSISVISKSCSVQPGS